VVLGWPQRPPLTRRLAWVCHWLSPLQVLLVPLLPLAPMSCPHPDTQAGLRTGCYVSLELPCCSQYACLLLLPLFHAFVLLMM